MIDLSHFATWAFVLASVVVFAGSMLQAVTGFGFAMFAAPLLAVISPELVPGPVLLLTLIFTMGVIRREWENVDWPGVGWILLGRLPFTLLAVLVMGYISKDTTTVVFAIFVLSGVVLSLTPVRIAPSAPALIITGGLAGFFGTITSIGAPPLALIYQHQKSSTVRGTLAVNIVVGCAFSLAMLVVFGNLSREDLLQASALVPASLIGLFASSLIVRRVNDAILRRLLLAIVASAAVFVLWRSV
ncbi:hypothetical protein SAMN03159496_00607 [Rhizobium sp. NFR07]|jgi:uncharacterized protein|uniref:sulfite exporter TauE/SafE family protein n=1 Tax=Rhizobium sp. NFR07 TaxID=1566262 RepID=UPI0008ED20A7|nr:sulfite exporter TauE/SafE family protein [Rhizobium sp. NFR07]SFA82725.1 hypothetical protein SAMN03159496_00607 [Rhizobium sp. NFR07]